jgi:glutathione S-transferase
MELRDILFLSGGILFGGIAFTLYKSYQPSVKSEKVLPTEEERLLQKVDNPEIKTAFINLREEREELKEQLQESNLRSRRVISEIHAEREELLHQLLDKERFTLTYFDSRGRAEQIRILLAECGANYTDKRVTREVWEESGISNATPLGLLPILEHNGRVFGESIAIMVYLAKIYERWPMKPETETIAVMILTAADDLRRVAYDAKFASDEPEKRHKTDKLVRYLQSKLPHFDKLLSRDGFFTSGRLTAADVAFWDTLDQISLEFPVAAEIISNFVEIEQWRKRIQEIPRISRYLSNRK